MSSYRLYIDSEKTAFTVEERSPAKALVKLCAMADLVLHQQDGRYGKAFTKQDGKVSYSSVSVSALTEPWSRRRLDPQERTTRL